MAMKMRENAFSFARRQSEVNGQHSPVRLQNPSHLGGAQLARVAWQMMQHDRGQYNVEVSVGKRQPLCHCIFKNDLDTSFSRFPLRPRKHFRGRIYPAYCSGWADMPFIRYRKASGSAADIQNRLSGLKAGKSNSLFSKRPLPT